MLLFHIKLNYPWHRDRLNPQRNTAAILLRISRNPYRRISINTAEWKVSCHIFRNSSTLHASSRLHQALADPIRLTIMNALLVQPLCVCVIKGIVNIAASKLSYHLSILKEQDFIAGEQQGNWIIYSITDRGRQALKCTERMGM